MERACGEQQPRQEVELGGGAECGYRLYLALCRFGSGFARMERVSEAMRRIPATRPPQKRSPFTAMSIHTRYVG